MLSALSSDSQINAQVEHISLQLAHPHSGDSVDLSDEGPSSLLLSHPSSSVDVESSLEFDGPLRLLITWCRLAINSISWRLPLSSNDSSKVAFFPQHSTMFLDSSQATTPVVLRRGVSPQRRSLDRLLYHLAYPVVMMITILVILPLAGTILMSPTQPELTEWAVCGSRLGVLACSWVLLLLQFCALRYWGFLLERQIRHDYPAWLYETWTAPGPLDDLFPWSQRKRTSGATLAQALASNTRMVLPPSSQAKRYDNLMSSSLVIGFFWSLAVMIILYQSSECLDSAPHLWSLICVILCIHASLLPLVALSWLICYLGSRFL